MQSRYQTINQSKINYISLMKIKTWMMSDLSLLSVKVKLVLTDGHRPDTFGQLGGSRYPRVNVHVTRSVRTATNRNPTDIH